ncbi:4'-phosphopantetheinyl transferase sfp [compost metagenome]
MDTQVYGLQLQEDMASSPLLELVTTLPEEKQHRIGRFVHVEDKVRALGADILSRFLICSTLGITNSEISLVQNDYGKPLLKDINHLHFNHSHSGCWVVSAISDQLIGIDVERIHELNLDIAKHCFSAQEFQDLDSLPDNQSKLEYFYDLWTLKESYIKAVGMGLSLPLSSFTIRKKGRSIQLTTSNTFNRCSFKQYTADSSYKISICAQREQIQDELVLISEDELYSHFINYL